MVDIGLEGVYCLLMQEITITLTETEAIEVFYTLKDAAEKQREYAASLMESPMKDAAFNAFDAAAAKMSVVDKLAFLGDDEEEFDA